MKSQTINPLIRQPLPGRPRKLIFAALSLALAMGSMTVEASKPKGKPFVAINDQIVEVSGAVSTLQGQIDELVDRVDTLDGRIDANDDALAILEDENDILQTLIAQNATDIDSINALIDDLDAQNQSLAIEENADAIAANDSLIQTLQAALVAVDQNQVILSSTTADLQAQIDNNLTLISLLEQETAFLDAAIATRQGLMNGTCPDGAAVTEITPDGQFVCSQLAGGGGLPEVEYVEVFQQVDASQWGSLFAHCNAGYTAVSGSMNMGTSYGKFLLVQPNINAGTGQSWVQGLMINEGPFSTYVTVKAVCLKTSE